jgi:hypothetical protein
MKTLTELITEVSLIISDIAEHPDYQALRDKGYSLKLNCSDLAHLSWIPDPLTLVAEIPEIEVTYDSRA